MELMATGISVQRIPGVGRDADRVLPFYSRHHTAGTADVDVLGQDVSHMPGSANACFGSCFPPPQMVAVVLQHMQSCKAKAMAVVPDARKSWFPLPAAATVRSVPVAAKGAQALLSVSTTRKGKLRSFSAGGAYEPWKWALGRNEITTTNRVLLVHREVHHCTVSIYARPGSHT